MCVNVITEFPCTHSVVGYLSCHTASASLTPPKSCPTLANHRFLSLDIAKNVTLYGIIGDCPYGCETVAGHQGSPAVKEPVPREVRFSVASANTIDGDTGSPSLTAQNGTLGPVYVERRAAPPPPPEPLSRGSSVLWQCHVCALSCPPSPPPPPPPPSTTHRSQRRKLRHGKKRRDSSSGTELSGGIGSLAASMATSDFLTTPSCPTCDHSRCHACRTVRRCCCPCCGDRSVGSNIKCKNESSSPAKQQFRGCRARVLAPAIMCRPCFMRKRCSYGVSARNEKSGRHLKQGGERVNEMLDKTLARLSKGGCV